MMVWPRSRAARRTDSVSAVSPDWLTKIAAPPSGRTGALWRNS
jgi:hypothetical protein